MKFMVLQKVTDGTNLAPLHELTIPFLFTDSFI